jgi:glycosyltransferase involved in cell wall biosynthesis
MTHGAVVYVSYDGALDPLGATQVVPYVIGLAAARPLALVTFEKADRWADASRLAAMRARLAAAGVEWRPLRYHHRPRLPATVWDILRGSMVIRRIAREMAAGLVHCRGEVAMFMARTARLPKNVRLILDRRGFFSDERVEAGSWRSGGLLDRLVRMFERGNLEFADGLVVLTQAGLDVLRARTERLPPIRVIPTCVDATVFRPRDKDSPAPEFAAVYSGSFGTWYMLGEMLELGREIARTHGQKVLFLSPDAGRAAAEGATAEWATFHAAQPEDVAAWLRRARASFFIIRPTPAKRASCPTKLAEALACGLPVVANRGIGDVDQILEQDAVGVLIHELTAVAYRRAAERLLDLLSDPELTARCRRVAERRFSLTAGIADYGSLYAEVEPSR